MHLDISQEDEEFRTAARKWLSVNVPDVPRPMSGTEMREFDTTWQRRQFEAGWAGITWPVELGGRGEPIGRELTWIEESVRVGAPIMGVNVVGLTQVGPLLIRFGTDEQRRDHLARILRGDEVWSQGFSEPDAGSDLASISTRAELVGDSYVVNGGKIWSSFAQHADRQELLVRTGSRESRHRGLTLLMADLGSEGVEIRPIKTITGRDHFCEVVYNDVLVPASDVIGTQDRGWELAMMALNRERGVALVLEQMLLQRVLDDLALDLEAADPEGDRRDHRSDLGVLQAKVDALQALALTVVSRINSEADAGPGVSISRVYYAELVQEIYSLALEALGPEAIRMGIDGRRRDWVDGYFESFGRTIGAGTTDIQRNVIAESILALPRGL
jgi:alkylation response protein AidB-like acyl-CoA dehydrogenase